MTAAERPRATGAARATALAPALILLASLLAGCAPLAPLGVSHDDYIAYRSTRVAPTFEMRLAAAARYLERHPSGHFAPQVRAYFAEAEPVFFAAKSGSVAGLETYLRTLPQGPHSEQALADLRRMRAARDDLAELGTATRMGARLSLLAAERARVRGEIEAWIRRFVTPAAWARPITEAPDDLIVAWSLGLPAPVCRALPDNDGPPSPPGHVRRCIKLLELPYTVSGEGAPEEMQATIEIAMEQDASGRPLEVTIGGPDMFLRLEETFVARSLTRADAAARASGIARAVAMVTAEFQARVSDDPACRKRAGGPAALELACRGLRAVVSPGSEGEDDTITIARTEENP